MCPFKMSPSQSLPESSGSHVWWSRLHVIATHSIRLEYRCRPSAAGRTLLVASARHDWPLRWTVAHTLLMECSHTWLSLSSFNAFGMLTPSLLKPSNESLSLLWGMFELWELYAAWHLALAWGEQDWPAWVDVGRPGSWLPYFPLRLPSVWLCSGIRSEFIEQQLQMHSTTSTKEISWGCVYSLPL